MAMDKPLKTIVTSVEGVVTYKALLFIPSVAPYDYYTKEYKRDFSSIQAVCLLWITAKSFCPSTSVL